MNKTKLEFKLWNKQTNKFVSGYKEANRLQQFEGRIIGCASDSQEPTHLSMSWWNEPDGYFTICRFTGLLDKQGKEIYEGDIVKYSINGNKEEIDTVRFSEGLFLPFNIIFVNYTGTDIKIIGNIYENPELLNPKDKNGKHTN